MRLPAQLRDLQVHRPHPYLNSPSTIAVAMRTALAGVLSTRSINAMLSSDTVYASLLRVLGNLQLAGDGGGLLHPPLAFSTTAEHTHSPSLL